MKQEFLAILAFSLTLFSNTALADSTFSDSDWVSMGGMPGANGIVFAMVKNKNTGVVYAGGSFTVIGPTCATNIAKWDGSKWSPVGNGIATNGTVRALALDSSGNLYAGGLFTDMSIGATNIAKWNGSAWSALGTGLAGQVLSVVADGSGNVYAGGVFTNKDINATNIARWQGGVWQPMGGGMNKNVSALALDGSGNVYAGGTFTQAGGAAIPNLAE